jgi:predicted DNA-binding protein (MmcQ/YjbR family)
MIGGRPSIAFRLSAVDVERVLRRKDAFVTPYGRGLWVSIWLDGAINWKLVESLLERSYRLVTKAPAARATLRPFDKLRVVLSNVEGRQAQGRPGQGRGARRRREA